MSTFAFSAAEARRLLAPIADVAQVTDAAVLARFAGIVWNLLTEPGDGVAGRIIADLGPLDALARLLSASLGATPQTTARDVADGVKRWTPRISQTAVRDALTLAGVRGIRHLSPGDDHWPLQLSDLGHNAPLALWVRGDTGVLARLSPSVALVGARAATAYGEHVAMELAADLSGSGIPIVSGAAYGIDGAAHRATLASGGETVALLAGGVDRPYPVGHTTLIDRITASGAVVSEVPCGSTPTKWRFLARNRLIAALSDATIVVEAGWRSGSLNTAAHAASMGRAIGAVPGPVTSGASAGCHRMLREFDATCITSAADVRELLPLGGGVTGAGPDAPMGGTPPTDDRSRVRDALSARSWRSTDDLAARSGMGLAEIEAHLGLLHLADEVERSPTGWRRNTARSGR